VHPEQRHLVVICLILIEILLMWSCSWPEFLTLGLACEIVLPFGVDWVQVAQVIIVQFLLGSTYFCLLESIPTGCGTHPAPYLIGTGGSFSGDGRSQDVKVTTHPF
jgi:hypothetical protein